MFPSRRHTFWSIFSGICKAPDRANSHRIQSKICADTCRRRLVLRRRSLWSRTYNRPMDTNATGDYTKYSKWIMCRMWAIVWTEMLVLTSTKLFVIKCWYLSLTRESATNFITVTSSTIISQPCAAHDIDWHRPSSMIFVVRYSPQQCIQNLWPHSRPVIIYVIRKKRKAKKHYEIDRTHSS